MKTAIKIVKPNVFNCGDDWEDYFVRIRDLRKGDVFYECSGSGENYELRVIENPASLKYLTLDCIKFEAGSTRIYRPNVLNATV